MRQALRLFLVTICLILCREANAGLFFCNDTGLKVAVAVGWPDGPAWLSRGWYRLEPRECTSTGILGVLRNHYYYYYIDSLESDVSWSGKGSGDAGVFCTSQAKFFYENDTEKCEGKEFIKLDVGDAQQYTLHIIEGDKNPEKAALDCQGEIVNGIDRFSKCWVRSIATDKQRRILDCIDKFTAKVDLALCASKNDLSPSSFQIATCADKYSQDRRGDIFLNCVADSQLTTEQARLFQCAVNNNGDYTKMGTCALSGYLSTEQRRLYGCVAENINDYAKAGLCAASDKLSSDQRRIASCVLNNRGSYTQMAVCSVGNNLTPEQQVLASCALSTGGQPYAFAGCVGTQLTTIELQKCLTDGIGGSGCFGKNNVFVKDISNRWKDVTKGPGPSNDLLGRDGFIGRLRGGPNSVVNNPGQIFGGPNSVVNNPGQVFGW